MHIAYNATNACILQPHTIPCAYTVVLRWPTNADRKDRKPREDSACSDLGSTGATKQLHCTQWLPNRKSLTCWWYCCTVLHYTNRWFKRPRKSCFPFLKVEKQRKWHNFYLVRFGQPFYQKFTETNLNLACMTSHTVVFHNRLPLFMPHADYSHILMTWLFLGGAIDKWGCQVN